MSLILSLYVLIISWLFSLTNASVQLELFPGLQCSYNYDLQVHTHRGERSTKELNFKINARVNLEVIDHHPDVNDSHFYVTRLQVRHPRVIRTNNGRTIRHVVSHNLEEQLSRPFFFLQDVKGRVTNVFYPHEDPPDIIGLKKGIVSALNLRLHHDDKATTYEAEEEDDSGIHVTYYNISTMNSTHVDLRKQWTSDDYRKHADGRPVEGLQHSKSHYDAVLKIEHNTIKRVERKHWSYLRNNKPYKRPLRHEGFQDQPDFDVKASGESQLHLLGCSKPLTGQRTKRSADNVKTFLTTLKRDSLLCSGMHRLRQSAMGNPRKPTQTFYELLRCHSDPSVKESELSQCVRELHYLARTDDGIFKQIVDLTLERSHQNFSTWSGLVGSLVVRGNHETQKILARVLLSEDPRPLTEKEHSVLLEAVFFLPPGPLYPDLFQALISLHKNANKSEEVSVRAMLTVSGLVRRCHEAGFNRSLSDIVVDHLHNSYKTHPSRYHDDESDTHEAYLRNHLWSFGNLGHPSALSLISQYLDHDNSFIRYSAVTALRKLPSELVDHHLLRVLKGDEHVTVRAGVMEVFIERRKNLTKPLKEVIEDALWKSEDGDELDSKITEYLESHGDESHHIIKALRRRREVIRRKKRSLIPALRPREFQLGPRKEWRRSFGGSRAGAEAMMRFANTVKLRIGIFGGSFEVDMDNVALFRAHVLKWSFDVIKGKAAFKMSASFKNDIPKDLIHTIADTSDDILAKTDALKSIFITHIQNFIDKLKTHLPLNANHFLEFVAKAAEFIGRTIQSRRFGYFFSQITKHLKRALKTNALWNRTATLVNNLTRNLASLRKSNKPFEEAFQFLNKLVDHVLKIGSKLPHGLPGNFKIKAFLRHISGSFSSIDEAANDYFKSLGVRIPRNLFEMLHFKITLRFPASLDHFETIGLRLLKFGNNFLGMLSVFRDITKVNLPRLSLPELAFSPLDQPFDFGLSFDWRIRFNFKVTFANTDLTRLRDLFRYLEMILEKLAVPDVDLDKFFKEILPGIRNDLNAKHVDLFTNTTGFNVVKWLREVTRQFQNFLKQQNKTFLDFSDTSKFVKELAKQTGEFERKQLGKVCRLQEFMLKSAADLQIFGANLENKTIIATKKIAAETQNVISEVVNLTLFVDNFIDELKKNLSNTAKEFAAKFLARLENSLGNVKELADNIAEFTSNSSKKLTGFCHQTANLSGKILDNIQSEADKATETLASFLARNSAGIKKVVTAFKSVVADVEKWHNKNLAKRLGKYAYVAHTLEEFLSLLKNENRIWKRVYEVSKNINEVIHHLNDLPEHAQKARDAADKMTDFTTSAKRWEVELKKLNVGRNFESDFGNKLQGLCQKFQELAQDSVKIIQGDGLFKIVKRFVTKETDVLFSRVVCMLDLLNEPAKRVKSELEKVSESVNEVETVLTELQPFSEHFSPILREMSQLPNCSAIQDSFDSFTNKCAKGTMAFGKQSYSEYQSLTINIGAFLELIPDEWRNTVKNKCIKGGTCLSEAFTKQAQEVAKKIKIFQKKFESKALFHSLEPCKEAIEQVSRVLNKIKNISKLVAEFTLEDDMKKIRDLARRITGKFSDDESVVVKRSAGDTVKNVRNLSGHMKKARETKKKIKQLVEQVFGKFESIYLENFKPFQENLKDVQKKLALSFDLTKKSANLKPSLQAVYIVAGAMTDFTNVARDVLNPLEGAVLDLFSKTADFTDVFDDKLKNYGDKVKHVSDVVNGLLDKVTAFLNTIQLRQKGLDIRDYKPWDQYPHCSEEVCLRLLRRASRLYLKTVFMWKYPHLNELSSFRNSGKWLVPGLFDDYKVRAIAQLSRYEMLLGMRGVAGNTNKASLLVVVDTRSSSSRVVKILQVQHNGRPFRGDMGGLAILKSSLIWMSHGDNIYAVRLSHLRSSMSTSAPSIINIQKIKSFSHKADSISYDERGHRIWIVDSNGFKAYSYDVSPFGDILSKKDSLMTGQYTRGLTIVRQFGIKYACVAKCTLAAGFQCKLEFHRIDSGVLDESTLHRVVRTPTGLESVQTVDSEHVVTAFSSGTFSDKDKIERIAGDFEDRFFKFKLPILSTRFGVTENCIFVKFASDWLIPAKQLFPIGQMKCGTRRKRNALDQAMDNDVYTEELEKYRVRRQTADTVPCARDFEGDPKRGSFPIVPEIGFYVPVYGISVYFFFGADGHYYANYRISLCLRDKQVKLALIPGAWVKVYAGVSLSFLVIGVGVTVEAKILETFLIPEIGVRLDRWPPRACLKLKMQMTPLSIRVYLWFRFRLCIDISIRKWFKIRIAIRWCGKITFAEWTWSTNSIFKTLFDHCQKKIDRTPPGVGVCSAKQVGNKKYLIQWRGFTEDTKIQHFIVTIGSIYGSGDDHYSVHGQRQSLLVSGLEIMHRRSVFVGVFAANADGGESAVAHCPQFVAKRRSPVVNFIKDGESSGDVDYQSDDTSIAMNYGLKGYFSEISSVKWGISSSPKCTLAAGEANVLGLRDIGESSTIRKTGMTLANGGRYYTRVVVINHVGLATVACSDGVVIDTTPPIPRGFTIGIKGWRFVPSVRRVSGKFQDFVEMESVMVRYEWKLVDEETGADVTSFKNIPLTQKYPLLDDLILTAGKRYTAVLRGFNAAGLYNVVNVTGIIPDDSVPICDGPVLDLINFRDNQDRDFVRQLSNITARFTCYDEDSGVQSATAAVGTYPGGDNVHPFINVEELRTQVSPDSRITWVVFTNVTVTSLIRYYVTVKVRNNAGLMRTLSSDGILVDTTGPTVLPTYIRDGLQGVDKKFSNRSDVFPAHWENAFADPESGIGEYFVGLGTSPGLDDQSKLRSYGLSTQAMISSFALESGVTYYVIVVGCNRVRMCVNASSNGAMVDFVPPHTGVVTSGHQGPAVKVTWVNKAAWARWQWCPADRANLQFRPGTCNASSFFDKHSGIKQFGLSVLSYDTAELVAPVKTAGRVVVSGRHIEMTNGVFSVLVEAEDRAGVRSDSVSESFIVDTTPPLVTQVHHGSEFEPVMFTRSENHVFTSYFEITEDVSDIVSYSVGVGSYPGGEDVISFVTYKPQNETKVLRVNWTLSETIHLVNGRKYYITVKGTNSAGLFQVSASEPLIFDDEKPAAGCVLDGWGTQDVQYHSFPTIYRMHWRGFLDSSGIKEAKVCLTSSQNGKENCDLHPKVAVYYRDSSHLFTSLRLQSGVYCYALLQLVDNAGNFGNYWSNGALVDISPPIKGNVLDGKQGQNLRHQRQTNILHASWSGFLDNETSIHHYELAFGTRPNMTDIQPFTDVGLVTSAASSNLLVPELQNGFTYYAHVIAYNPLGISSEVATSDGVLVDSTPPIFSSLVFDGTNPGTNADYTSDVNSLSANWKCEDEDSGISQAFVGFGTQPGSRDLASYQAVLPYKTSFTLNNITLIQGQRYFATIKCTNKVGLQSTASSDGLTFDSTPPYLRFLHDGLHVHHDAVFTTLYSPLSASWRFVDPESHILSHYVSVVHSLSSKLVSGPTLVPRSQESVQLHLQNELKHGERYHFSVTAENGAGLNTTAVSDGLIIDGTAPTCSSIYDTTVNGIRTTYAGQTTKLSAYFECDDKETGLKKYQFAIKDTITSQNILPFHEVKAVTASSSFVVIDGSGRQILQLKNGGRYQVGVRVTNKVNLTKDFWTPGVMIDSTPPVFRKVVSVFHVHSEAIRVDWVLSDNESDTASLLWSLHTFPDNENPGNFTEIYRNSSKVIISGTALKQGETYYVYLKATNKAGLSTLVVSDGVIIDRTPPMAGLVSAAFVVPMDYDGNPNFTQNASFIVKWSGFVDPESSIRSYKWAVGLSKETTMVLGDDGYGEIVFLGTLNGYVIKGQTIYTDTTYYICIRVSNGAGLTSTGCSQGILVKLGRLTAGVVYDGPLSADIDFQLDDRAVWLHWSGFEDPVYGLKKYEWCYGQFISEDADQMNCTTSLNTVQPPLKSSAHRFHNVSLDHGQRYGVKVQAFNLRDQTVSSLSDGFTVDRTPPSAGIVKVSGSRGTPTVYLTGISAPTITWVMNEEESAIEEIIVSVGSHPEADDLLPSTKLDGKLRSVNLDDMNFTLSHAMSFFVTITGTNVLGLVTSITSPQVIVDWIPPTPAVVRDGNGTSDVSFQTGRDHVSATWTEFVDPESGIVEYKYCIGTRPDSCGVWNLTSANLDLQFRQDVNLEHGVTYFVTVTAINGAGLSSSSSSSGVTVDTTPPNIRGFNLVSVVVLEGNMTHQLSRSNVSVISTNPWTISATWENINDDESEIQRMSACVGKAKNNCDLLPWTDIDPETPSFTFKFPKRLQSGTAFLLSLKAENGAGLKTTVHSERVIVDISPPLAGTVKIGESDRLMFLREGEPLSISWLGFEDLECDIRNYEWKICSAIEPTQCVSSFVNVGTKTSVVVNEAGIKHGKDYRFHVKAVNNAELETEAVSTPFMLDQTAPEIGMVFDGNTANDQLFQSSSSELAVNWKGFKDKESGISGYEVCVGSRPGLCDVRQYASVAIAAETVIQNLNLTHNSTYYTSVQAVNGAGQISSTSSNGIIIDLTSPVGGGLRDGEGDDMVITAHDSFVSANWEEFNDPESGVSKYVTCAGSAKGACDILPLTVVNNRLAVAFQVWPYIGSGTIVYFMLRVHNEAGGVTEVHSDGVLVDTTPPEPGKVKISSLGVMVGSMLYLTSRTSLCAMWNGFSDAETSIVHYHLAICYKYDPRNCPIPFRDLSNRTSICIDDPPVTEGQKYFIKIRASNQVDLSSTAHSPVFVVDTTEPDIGVVTASNPLGNEYNFISSQVLAGWRGFIDPESGVFGHSVCVGTEPGLCDVTELTSVGDVSRYTWSNLNLTHNEEYYVSIKAINKAGLSTNFTFSDPVTVDKTAPNQSLVLEGPEPSKDIDFQRSRTHVAATWFTIEDSESEVAKLTWCVGTTLRSCDLKTRSLLEVTETNVSAYLDQPIQSGMKYYVTLAATNGAGLRRVMISDGVVVDYTPPRSGSVIDGRDEDVDYINNTEDIYAYWSGFEDLESGIKSYEFALCEKENITACPSPFSDIGAEVNVSLSGVELVNGKEYVVVVHAINMVGLSVQASSDGFRVDTTPPVAGKIWIVNPETHVKDNQMSVRWGKFLDPESGLSGFEVCLGTTQDECDVKDFDQVGKNATHIFTDTGLLPVRSRTYYVIVKAFNNAGLSTRVVSKEINADFTPPQPVKEKSIFSSDLDDVCNAVSDNNCETSDKTRKKERPVDIYCFGDLIKATWLEHEDKESGIKRVEWRIEADETFNVCDIRAWEEIQTNVLSKNAIVHFLPNLNSVRVLVRITNGVGNSVLLKSALCEPQKSFPPEIKVNEIHDVNDTETDIDYQTNVDAILVAWFFPNTSAVGNVSRVQAALISPFQNTTQSLLQLWRGEPLVFEFFDVPPGKTFVTFSGDRLKPYIQYRAVIRVWSEFGLYRDAVSDGIVILPRAPTQVEVNVTDEFLGTEQARWQRYVDIPGLTRSIVENTYYVSDPFSVVISVVSSDTNVTVDKDRAIYLQPTYQATVYRVTSGENETRNETEVVRTILEHSHVLDDESVCCSKVNRHQKTVYADKQFKPVHETKSFGASVGALDNNLIAVSSMDGVLIFSTRYLDRPSITLKSFNNSWTDGRLARVQARHNTVLVSINGNVMLYNINIDNSVEIVPKLLITNCNYTVEDEPKCCVEDAAWSSAEGVGKAFNYDGSDAIVVSGIDPTNGNSVVAVFENKTIWKLRQVLNSGRNNTNFREKIVVSKNFLVVLRSGLDVYSKGVDNLWKEESYLSEELSKTITSATNVQLTESNELFIISAKLRSLSIFELSTSPAGITRKCRHVFSDKLELSGSFDVMEAEYKFVAIGVRNDGREGAELVVYEPNNGCTRIGGVVTKKGPHLDEGRPSVSVALAEYHIVLGTPEISTWPTDHVKAGTGRVYLTKFCPQNFVRRKVSDFDNQEDVTCTACGVGEKAYSGFEEHCVNCSRSICADDSRSLSFRVPHCERYPCSLHNNRKILQNTSLDNLTVTEVPPGFSDDKFYLPGSEQSYFIRITQLSRSGLTTVSDSGEFSIDNTSPEPGSVYDGLGSDGSRNCSANTTFGSTHQCASRSFSKTDLDFTNNTAEISARWIDFRDNESNIQHLFWCIGSSPLSDDILRCENATNYPNRTLAGLFLQHNDSYYVTIVACNYAGLCTARSSDGVLVDTTPPVIHYVRDGLIGPDIDFQVFTNIIFGNWAAEDPESGVVSFEVGWGSAPGLDDVWEFQEVGNASAWYAKFPHRGLVKGNRYYVTVRAINEAGLESEAVSSNGIVVGKTEFLFSKNDSGSFFFDTVNVNANETLEESEVGHTFGTLDVPSGAVDEDVKFQVYRLSEKELKNGTDSITSVVDPEVVKPPKTFKLANYSFQIKAFERSKNKLQSEYHFKKPIIISLFYNVNQMLKANKKVVSNEVTKKDIDPVLLLWDTRNQTWFDAAKTCPVPWSFVDHAARVLKVQICHLTQFALFWTFKAENGIVEFHKQDNASRPSPHAVYEKNNSVTYNKQRYGNQIILDVIRRKGSTGNINVTWDVVIQSGDPSSLGVSPMNGQLAFMEGQWNSSVHLQFTSIPDNGQGATMLVKLNNVTGGAMFGNFSSVRVVFPRKVQRTKYTRHFQKFILRTATGALLLIGVVVLVRRAV